MHCKRNGNPRLCNSALPEGFAIRIADSSGFMHRYCQTVRPVSTATGRRSQIGSLFGPRNDSWLNGANPAMLADLRCNSDARIPCGVPITPATHADQICDCISDLHANVEETLAAAHSAQDAQVGYTCESQHMRGPTAANEVKEWMKGHANLSARI